MQRGSLVKAERKNGPDVWQFRWSEKGGDGRRVYRKWVIGTIEQYSEAAAAQQLAARIIAKPSSSDFRPAPAMTVARALRAFPASRASSE
jgi:integrase